jgi:hypothetical protein
MPLIKNEENRTSPGSVADPDDFVQSHLFKSSCIRIQPYLNFVLAF